MSVPSPRQAYAFLAPLKNKSSTFLVQGRPGNLLLARFALGCLATLRTRTLIFDTSCLYRANTEILTSGLPDEFMRNTSVITVSTNYSPETSLAGLVMKEAKAIIIDDLNTLHNLLSRSDRSSSIHKLFLLLRMLSYEARANGRTIITTIYRRAGTPLEKGPKRSLSAVADLRVIAETTKPSSLTFKCNEIESWPTDGFRADVYFDVST